MKEAISARLPSLKEVELWLGEKVFGKDRSIIILYVAIIAYTLVFSVFTLSRHYAFKTGAWDLGIFTQSLWTTANGKGFLYHTCELPVNPSGCFFGVHFSPILFLVLPLYSALQRPETLLVFQSFVIALAALPIYKLAKEHAHRVVGLVFAFAYLMYPAIQFLNWYDFHIQAFLPFFFSFTIYYISKENWPRYSIFVLLSLMCEEHVTMITFFIGAYVAWKYRRDIVSAIKGKRLTEKRIVVPFLTMLVSIVWYWFTLWQRDTFFPTNPQAMEEFLGSGNFSILGAKNPLEIPLLVIIRPWNAIQALMYNGPIKLVYIGLLFGPLAFFSLKAPSALIPTLPWFGFSLMSQSTFHYTLGTQYQAYTVSFIFAAAVFAVRKNYLKNPRLGMIKEPIKKIIVFSIIFLVGASPLSFGVNIFFPDYTSVHRGEHEIMLSEVLNAVPPSASILTQNNLFPHVSHRVNAYVIPDRWLNSSIHDLIVDFVNQTMDDVEYILVDNKTNPESTKLAVSLLETKPQFSLLMSKDKATILLYRRTP